MKKKLVSVMLVSLLALGLGLVGCNTGSGTPTDVNDGSLDGTWTYGGAQVIIDGSNYTTINNYGVNYDKGTVVYDDSNLYLTSTHYWNGNGWTPEVVRLTVNYVLSGDGRSMTTLSGFTGDNANLNGVTWTR
jgi:predicted small secreted protein